MAFAYVFDDLLEEIVQLEDEQFRHEVLDEYLARVDVATTGRPNNNLTPQVYSRWKCGIYEGSSFHQDKINRAIQVEQFAIDMMQEVRSRMGDVTWLGFQAHQILWMEGERHQVIMWRQHLDNNAMLPRWQDNLQNGMSPMVSQG